jgi:hypothetical protein
LFYQDFVSNKVEPHRIFLKSLMDDNHTVMMHGLLTLSDVMKTASEKQLE